MPSSVAVCLANRCGPRDFVIPSAGLSCVEMDERMSWSVETQSRSAKCLMSIWRVLRVGRWALAMAIAARLSSYRGVADS